MKSLLILSVLLAVGPSLGRCGEVHAVEHIDALERTIFQPVPADVAEWPADFRAADQVIAALRELAKLAPETAMLDVQRLVGQSKSEYVIDRAARLMEEPGMPADKLDPAKIVAAAKRWRGMSEPTDHQAAELVRVLRRCKPLPPSALSFLLDCIANGPAPYAHAALSTVRSLKEYRAVPAIYAALRPSRDPWNSVMRVHAGDLIDDFALWISGRYPVAPKLRKTNALKYVQAAARADGPVAKYESQRTFEGLLFKVSRRNGKVGYIYVANFWHMGKSGHGYTVTETVSFG